MLKDYYKILELPPNATVSDVKKNFRRLALRYHPDTNQGNRYAEAWYREIQEAYETLSDTDSRDEYLQQRWLLKSQGRPFDNTVALTPPFILKQAQELLEQVKNIDHFRMDHNQLQQQILMAADDEHLYALNSYKDEMITTHFIYTIQDCLFPLEFRLLKPIIHQIHKLQPADNTPIKNFGKYYARRKKEFIWERYSVFIILAVTIGLCLIIYIAS
jgi:curved DNA-binding protein CbpA